MKMTENTLLNLNETKMPSGKKLRNTFIMKTQKFCTSKQKEMMDYVRVTNSTALNQSEQILLIHLYYLQTAIDKNDK